MTLEEARARLIATIVAEFKASGIEYTCGAVVMSFARKRIIPLTEHLPAAWLVHPTFSMRRIERDAWQAVHKEYQA